MTPLFAGIALVILTGLSHDAWAQAGSADFPSVASSSVLLVNQANRALNFAIRPADGNWGSYSVDSGNSTTISCDGCSTPYFEFSMKTENREVGYRLNPAERYVLYWNADKNLWDLARPSYAR